LNFTEPAFLFLFLPWLLAINFALPKQCRNLLLTLASLLFYAIGEPTFVAVLMGSCLFNYAAALAIDRCRGKPIADLWLVLAVIANLQLLGAFKYFTFFVSSLQGIVEIDDLLPEGFSNGWPDHLPLGISFFTFHAISYVVDVYRGTNRAERNPLDVVLYVTLFPQLIAGPIIRYHDVAAQIKGRTVRLDDFADGVGRFVVGLGKKMLIANTVAVAADGIFAIPGSQLTASLAWLGIACYTVQIYFDFSGYSDMAIGLGRMFGFRFLENFNYPYVSGSITEFWRRWHISLSNWFRDYLYIPLGGNRVSPWRTYINLIVVFLLCGLWHGASLTFIAWGAYHGLFLVIERLGLLRWLTAPQNPLRHVYALLVVSVGWVLFRAPTLSYGMEYLAAMAGLGHGASVQYHVSLYADRLTWIVLAVACVGSMPVIPMLTEYCQSRSGKPSAASNSIRVVLEVTGLAAMAGIFIASVSCSAAGTYNPFIYFQF